MNERYRKAFLDSLYNILVELQDDVRRSETYEEYINMIMQEYDFRNALVQLYGQDLIDELNEGCRLEAFYNDARKEMKNG